MLSILKFNMAEEREALERELRVRLKKLYLYLRLALRGGQKEAEEVITLYDEFWRLMNNQPKLPENKGNKLRRSYG